MGRLSRNALVVLSVAAVAGGAWWLRRSAVVSDSERERRAAEATVREAARSGEAALEDLASHATPLAELGADDKRWRELLTTAMVVQSVPDEPKLAGETNEVLTTASRFLAQRFGSPSDAGEFMAWRRESGYSLKSIEEMGTKDIAGMYEAIVGSPMPPDASAESVYKTLYERTIDGQNAFHLPSLVGMAPGSVVVAFKWSEVESHPDFPMLEAGLGQDAWYGGLAFGYGQWWKPPHSYHELLRDHGRVLLSTVGLAMQSTSGDWKTLQLNFQFDAGLAKWFLISAFHYNADMESAQVSWMY